MRRFSVHRREVSVALSSRRLPSTAAFFREYLDGLCPKFVGRGFRLECSVWRPSPYAIVPNKFAQVISFRSVQGAGDGVGPEYSELENTNYERLLTGCREYARTFPQRLVEFEIKIAYFKEGVGEAGVTTRIG
jgi:hypothetical protein